MGLLKAKLAKFRTELMDGGKGGGGKGEGFDVMKSGDARVAMIGFPSVGQGQHNNNNNNAHKMRMARSETLCADVHARSCPCVSSPTVR